MINWDANPDDAFNVKEGYFRRIRDHTTRQFSFIHENKKYDLPGNLDWITEENGHGYLLTIGCVIRENGTKKRFAYYKQSSYYFWDTTNKQNAIIFWKTLTWKRLIQGKNVPYDAERGDMTYNDLITSEKYRAEILSPIMFNKIIKILNINNLNLEFEGRRIRYIQYNPTTDPKIIQYFTYYDIFKFSAFVTYNKTNDVIQLTNINNLNKDLNYPMRKINDIYGNSDCFNSILNPLFNPTNRSLQINNPAKFKDINANIFLSSINDTSPTIIN